MGRFEKAAQIFAELGDHSDEAMALMSLGMLHGDAGQQVQAIKCLERATALFHELGDGHNEGLAALSLGIAREGPGWTRATARLDDELAAERAVLKRLVPFLEDRRVLYNPSEVEVPEHCIESVLRIRQFLVEQAGQLHEDSALGQTLRNIAGCCRAFLDGQPEVDRGEPLRSRFGWGWEAWNFNQGLGQLRGQLGMYLDELAERYGLKITKPLAALLPPRT